MTAAVEDVTGEQVQVAAQAAADAATEAGQARAAAETANRELIKVRERVRTGDVSVQPADLTAAAAAAEYTTLAAEAAESKAATTGRAHRRLAADVALSYVSAQLDPLQARVDEAQAAVAAAVRALAEAHDENAAAIRAVSAEMLAAHPGQVEEGADVDAGPYAWLSGQAWDTGLMADGRRYEVPPEDLAVRVGMGVRAALFDGSQGGVRSGFRVEKMAHVVKSGR